jgi:tRNA A37 threonylcarbamoyladenosine dehydratase
VREQLARNYAFLREDGVSRVRAASVVVVGCGGVGSWTAVMLARSGVAKLRLIDFDYVTLSSLNRHATAALADVGTPKVQCIARALRGIAPFVQVDPRVELWRGDADGAELLRGADWVVGACAIFLFFCPLVWWREKVVDALFFLVGFLQMRLIILVQRSN